MLKKEKRKKNEEYQQMNSYPNRKKDEKVKNIFR